MKLNNRAPKAFQTYTAFLYNIMFFLLEGWQALLYLVYNETYHLLKNET